MIANIGPADYNYDETLNTCRFASRAKNIKNAPKVNEDPKDTMMREFQEEIKRLKAALAAQEIGADGLDGDIDGSNFNDGDVEDAETEEEAGAAQVAVIGGKVRVTRVVEKIVESGVSEAELDRIRRVAEAKKAEVESAAEAEAAALHAETSELAQRQSRVARELAAKKAVIDAKRADRMQLKANLRALEAKLVVGKQMIAAVQEQQTKLAKQSEALSRHRAEREQVEAELRAKEENQLEMAEAVESLESRVATLTANWQKLVAKYEAITEQISTEAATAQKHREELLDTIREQKLQIQLLSTIQHAFIPPQQIHSLQMRMHWDDKINDFTLIQPESNEWKQYIQPPRARPNRLLVQGQNVPFQFQLQQPISLASSILLARNLSNENATAADIPFRYKRDNLLQIHLDLPIRGS